MAQTSYSIYMDEAFAGMQEYIDSNLIYSYAAEGAIPFGYAIVKGTDAEKQVKVASASDDVFVGVAMHSHDVEKSLSGIARYEDKDTVNAMVEGHVYVPINQDVVVDDPVFFIYTGADAGKFRKDNTTSDAVQITGAKFLKSASAGQVALIHLK